MGAGYHGGFGKTKGSLKHILSANNKLAALNSINILPDKIQQSYTKYVKDSTTSKYVDFKVTKTDFGYIFQSKKPGDVPGSYAIYFKEIDQIGNTIKVYKDSYDNKGKFIHRKYK